MSLIEEYTTDMSSRLRLSRRSRSAVLDEVRDHLLESTAQACALGTSRDQAEFDAVVAFGSAASIARQFNAAGGAQAMRRAPLVALVAGAMVVAAFLAAAVSQPQATQQATVAMQVSFFLGVIAFQVAVAAGACGASRALATWRTSATSGGDRAFVRRCTIISMAALSAGVVAMTTNLILDARQPSHANVVALVAGAAGMIASVAVGLVTSLRLDVNAADEDTAAGGVRTPALFTLGDSMIALVRCYPVLLCAAVTIAAATWAMSHAEAATVAGALSWGVSEAVAVVAGFVLLGPALGLRPPRRRSAQQGRGVTSPCRRWRC